jgi:hypothetical protein
MDLHLCLVGPSLVLPAGLKALPCTAVRKLIPELCPRLRSLHFNTHLVLLNTRLGMAVYSVATHLSIH